MEIIQKEDMNLCSDVEQFEILNLDYALENYDTPLDVTMVCFPNESNPRELMTQFAKIVYGEYIDNANKLTLLEARELAVKKSHLSSLELDIKIKALIEFTFKAEVEEMYAISWDIIEFTEPNKIHQMIKDLKIVEEAFVQTKPEKLSDSTLYKNKKITGYNMYSL